MLQKYLGPGAGEPRRQKPAGDFQMVLGGLRFTASVKVELQALSSGIPDPERPCSDRGKVSSKSLKVYFRLHASRPFASRSKANGNCHVTSR